MTQHIETVPRRFTERHSRQTALLINLVKVALLAALAPPVVAGLAAKAVHFGSRVEPAAVVSVALSLGAVGAVLGAVLLGRLADVGRGSHRSRWSWVAVGSAVGTAGLVLAAASSSAATLIAGWAVAQLGYSGAMAVLRALLASTSRSHLRRGAVAVVFAAYGGLAIPLLLLLLFPGAVWETSLGLAAVALGAPLVILVCFPPARTGAPLIDSATEATGADAPGFAGTGADATASATASSAASASAAAEPSRALPMRSVLLVQCLSAAVIAAFVAYHPLDLSARMDAGSFPTAASTWVLIAAILGLVSATALLFWFPALLASSRTILVGAGALLAVSLVVRGSSDSIVIIMAAAVLSGIAVGSNNAALLSTALESAPPARAGRFIGLFSAAGALGQFVGPLLGLAVLTLARQFPALPIPATGSYSVVILALAALPVGWSLALALPGLERRKHVSAPRT